MSGPREVPPARPPARWAAFAWLATALLLAMTTWFSASAVVSQVRDLWSLSPAAASMLTIAVQLGFVVGAVTSALPSIADLVPPRHLMAAGAVGASLANLALLVASGGAVAIALRLATGVYLAGIYPPASQVQQVPRHEGGVAVGEVVVVVGAVDEHRRQVVVAVGWRELAVAPVGRCAHGGSAARVPGTTPPGFRLPPEGRLGPVRRFLR